MLSREAPRGDSVEVASEACLSHSPPALTDEAPTEDRFSDLWLSPRSVSSPQFIQLVTVSPPPEQATPAGHFESWVSSLLDEDDSGEGVALLEALERVLASRRA